MITASSSLTDVAFAVSTVLDAAGFVTVLTGGSAATYYAPAASQSKDIDFVITLNGKGGEEALASLGFTRTGDYYVHSKSPFPLEFPPGPLAIGEDLVTTWSSVRRKKEVLHVLSPTDSCRDRLASYLFWNDFSGLEQALAVQQARPQEISLKAVRDWCRREGHAQKYDLFAARLP